MGWLELEVTREPGGRPLLELRGRAAERARELGVRRVSLSLTHPLRNPPQKRRRRVQRSKMWRFFAVLKAVEGEPQAAQS